MKKFRVAVYRATRIEKRITFSVTARNADDAHNKASWIAAGANDDKWRIIGLQDYDDEFSIREMC